MTGAPQSFFLDEGGVYECACADRAVALEQLQGRRVIGRGCGSLGRLRERKEKCEKKKKKKEERKRTVAAAKSGSTGAGAAMAGAVVAFATCAGKKTGERKEEEEVDCRDSQP